MTLIAVLLALALEHFFGALDQVRTYRWFDAWHAALERRFTGSAWWDGPAGLMLAVVPPLVLLLIVAHLLAKISIILVFLLTTAVLIHSLGPDFNTRIGRSLGGLEAGDDTALRAEEAALPAAATAEDREGERGARAFLLRAHEDLFGVLFWFIVLGMVGALLFCLARHLRARLAGIHGGHAAAVERLYLVLSWPSARLFALGMALAGSLVDAMEAWRSVERTDLAVTEELIGSVGMGALNLSASGDDAADPRIVCLEETRALINRTLIIWLTVLGLMTLRGWFA
jgi:membrane protein required for beta-lactamase induction